MRRLITIFLLVILLFSSCATTRNTNYVNTAPNEETTKLVSGIALTSGLIVLLYVVTPTLVFINLSKN